MSEQKPETQPDIQSDPSLDDAEGSEWSDEGGATAEGPATDPDDGTATDEQG